MSRTLANRILVDTGPLVSVFSKGDLHHESCVEALREMHGPLYSCWPVITDAAWLLRGSPRAIQKLLGLLNTGFLEVLPLNGAEAKPIAALMEQYKNIHPQLADAALVYLAGRERIDTIFTLDRRDFSIYRPDRKRSFRILPA